METNDNTKPVKVVRINMKEIAQHNALIDDFAKIMKEGSQAFIEYGRENYETMQTELQKYYNEIDDNLAKIKDDDEKCFYLHEEKRKCINDSINARFGTQRFSKKTYKKIISEKIEPLLEHWESLLKFKNGLPPKNRIIENQNPSYLKIVENNQQTKPICINKAHSNEVVVSSKLPAGFSQIKCDATQDEILNYFMILSKEKNTLNNEIFMEESDIVEFVKKNFEVFNSVPTGDYFQINLLPRQKRTLIYFVFQFYLKYDRKVADTKIKYVLLLINNFELFKHDKPKVLLSNMSESKRPVTKNIISTKIHLSK